MKKNLILIVMFCISLSFNANAGKSIDCNDFKPKNEISDYKDSKKLKTIQKIFNTKIAKKIERFIIKKTIKRLQKQIIKQQNLKFKNAKSTSINGVVMFVLSILMVLGGIAVMIWGNLLLGIILTVIGILLLVLLGYLLLLAIFNPANWKWKKTNQ